MMGPGGRPTCLVFGAAGQVGRELARRRPLGLGVRLAGRGEIDVADRRAVAAAIAEQRPSLVVNAAAYTAVDRAESDAGGAFAVNRDGPAHIAEACARHRIPLIHISTDYVFDGTASGPYSEDDPISPVNVYGASKAAGEQAVRYHLDEHVILRTSWVFSPFRDNFVRTMVTLARSRPELRVVADQRGGPTAAGDIADAVYVVARRILTGRGEWGTFHFSGGPAVSRFDFAEAIVAASRRRLPRPPRLVAVPSTEFPTPARRPANAVLDCARIAAAYGVAQPAWRRSLAAVASELNGEPM